MQRRVGGIAVAGVADAVVVGVYRIVGLGDSFTFGTGVRAGETFLAELERQLAAERGAGRFEGLNLGVMGPNGWLILRSGRQVIFVDGGQHLQGSIHG